MYLIPPMPNVFISMIFPRAIGNVLVVGVGHVEKASIPILTRDLVVIMERGLITMAMKRTLRAKKWAVIPILEMVLAAMKGILRAMLERTLLAMLERTLVALEKTLRTFRDIHLTCFVAHIAIRLTIASVLMWIHIKNQKTYGFVAGIVGTCSRVCGI